MFLVEGGNAANGLLKKLQQQNPKRKLERVKIPKDQLELVWRDAVEPILAELKDAGVLDDTYETKFNLGSTKLAYEYIKGSNDDNVSAALDKKQFFGDIDIDIMLKPGIEAIDAANILIKSNQNKFLARPNGSEANMAVVIDGMELPNEQYVPAAVIQIDLVNMRDKGESISFLQSSDESDTSSGIKGVFHKFLLRAIIRKMSAPNINPETHEAKQQIAKWTSQGYSQALKPRFSLKDEGLRIVIDMTKNGTKEVKTIPLQRNVIADFSSNGLSKIAKIIFGSDYTSSDIKSSTALCKSLITSNNTKDKIYGIWKEFVKMSTDFKYQIDTDDFEQGMTEIAKLLNQKYKEVEENTMDNIRESIKRNLYEDDAAIIEEIMQSLNDDTDDVCDSVETQDGMCQPEEKSSLNLSEEEISRLKEAYMSGFMSTTEAFNGKNARRVYRNSALKPESVVWNKNHKRGFENFIRKLG